MEDCFDTGCLSYFTSNHDKHDEQWLQKGSQLTLICFACFVEIIENNNEPSIRKTRVVHELLNLISTGNILNILKTNDSVVFHLLNCLWELIDFDENNASQNMTVVEIICQLCCSLKSEAFLGKVMEYLLQKITAAENVKKVSPQLDLLGKLLQKIPGLAKNVVCHRQNIITCLANGLDSHEERIQSSLFFIITHFYRDEDTSHSAIPVTTTETIFRECCEALTNATSKELQINSIALLQSLTIAKNLPKSSQTLAENIGRAIICLKKAFLSKDDLVKSLAIGCLDNLVVYDESIIDSDLTGFLFEVFTTKSESLLSLGFQCVSKMVEKKRLYTKGHMIYGFETVISALMMVCENKNSKLVKQGLGVLTKILANCPVELSLINSKKVLLQCLDVINRGLCSSDDAVFLQACRCFSSFLEKRHFACDVPYSRLMALIEPLVERLEKSCTSTGHWNHAENKDLKSSMIGVILEVIKKSLDLVLCAKNESPTLEALLVSQENNTIKEFEEFLNRLLQLCDQVCIPNVIANFKKFYGTAIPEIFFEILNKLLCTCPMESMKEMSEKFVSSCFIRIALDTKAYYLGRSSSATLQQSVNTFLEIICRRLSSPDRITSNFCARLQNVNGAAQELLQVLKQNNSGNEALRETQECILVIFRLAYLYGDRLVTTSQLLQALSSFLVLNTTCYENSVIIPRCLTQLYITELHRHGDSSNDAPQLGNAKRILADGISKYVHHLETIYFHDFAMVEWALETQDLNPVLRKEIVEFWFSHSEESNLGSKEMERWENLVERHPSTLLFLASILGTGEARAQSEILRVLQHVLSACATESEAFQNTSKELKIAIQKLFLNQAVEPLPDKNMHSILKLLSLLVTSSPKGPLDNDFMKLIYHVANLLKQPENSEKLSTECLNFLNTSVIHEAISGSDQVLGFFLKHHDCNKFLESVIGSFHNAMNVETCSQNYNTTLAAVLVSITYLTRFQKMFGITSEDKVEINIDVVLSLLCHTASPLLQFAANIFWASILQTDESTSFVSLTAKLPSNTKNVNQELTKNHLRIILVRLQNSLLHSNPLVQMSALRCLEAFLSSEKEVKDLVEDPWNKIVLREVLFSSESATLLTLQLYSLFLNQERKYGVNLNLPVMDLLGIALEKFGVYDISSDPNCVEWLSAYARFFLEVIQWKSDAMTSLQKSNLKYHVENLIDSYPEALLSKKQNGFVYVQEVLIHDEIIQGKRIDPLKALKELSDLLK